MPRPKKESGAQPKTRSRTGCWPCKARKVKCGEEKPMCTNCVKNGETCDYSIRLNWGGRSKRDKDGTPTDGGFTFVSSPTDSIKTSGNGHGHGHGHEHIFSAQHIATLRQRPPSSHPGDPPTPERTPGSDSGVSIDPDLRPVLNNEAYQPPYIPQPMLPLVPGRSPTIADRGAPTSAPVQDDFNWSPQHRAKRVRLSSPVAPASQSPAFAIPQYPPHAENLPNSAIFAPYSINSIVNTPNTPGSSVHSNSPFPSNSNTLTVQDPPDLRRLSVKSLLSDPSEEEERAPMPKPRSKGHRTYGYDHGFPDLDIPRNDDNGVFAPRSPDLRRPSVAFSEISVAEDGEAKQMAFEPNGYYAEPVPIRIPRVLEPLPQELIDNQMNLLYFHHFINHTGRILVPHDCPENPFRSVLPKLAVGNTHLLRLLLAFSASHRAKLLGHPEPVNRIAEWLSDVLPALRSALDDTTSLINADPADPSNLAPLATAIMLTAYEIASPSTYDVRIPWQQHLRIARQLIVDKGGLGHIANRPDGARDKLIFFLSRWFAYLDVFGSLSDRRAAPLFGAYNEDGGGLWLVNRNDEEIYQIDCFFGFSGRCLALLAQVAELAAQAAPARLDPATDLVRPGWQPTPELRQAAENLQRRLHASSMTVFTGCLHTPVDPVSPSSVSSGAAPSPAKSTRDMEIYMLNDAFHQAGIIHLRRRVMAKPATDPEVQECVSRIAAILRSLRPGSAAEMCLLFPIFSAGCEACDPADRELFQQRLMAVEGWGMEHVRRTREILQAVWTSGREWEVLVEGQFFG